MVDLERMEALEALASDGVAPGLLGTDDLEETPHALEPGNAAGVLVHENVRAAPFAAALRRAAARGSPPAASLVAGVLPAVAADR
jgi:hypothetical protein